MVNSAYAWNETIKKLTNNIELVVNDIYQYKNNPNCQLKLLSIWDNDEVRLSVVYDNDKMYDVGELIIAKSYDLEKVKED